jgi:hypothetical protein
MPPRHLLTINWADSRPGFSWPVAYYVAWLPYYDRFVVTASADCPDGFGYCDFAIGSFGIETPLKEGARKAISARISRVEEAFAKRYGWTPDRASRVWGKNPACQARQTYVARHSSPDPRSPLPGGFQRRLPARASAEGHIAIIIYLCCIGATAASDARVQKKRAGSVDY